jgi:uncharacterized OB-fold protein
MQTTSEDNGATKMLCSSCGVLVFHQEEHCTTCETIRGAIASAAIEKTQAETAAAHAEERIKIAVAKLEKVKADQRRVTGLQASRH